MKAKDRHHIVPRVRYRDLGINPDFPGNITRVGTSKHRAWHTLFGSMTTEEATRVIKSKWSLSEEAQAIFTRLTRNVQLIGEEKMSTLPSNCNLCGNPIRRGMDVRIRAKAYHAACAAAVAVASKEKCNGSDTKPAQ